MNRSIEHKLRAWLDAPLLEKGAIFWIFFPLFATLSACWFFCSWWRRRQGHRAFPRELQNVPVICVGNVIVGGVGKSPVVRALARNFLDRGWAVAIVSRGFGGNSRGAIRVSSMDNKQARILLSDENREHLETLCREYSDGEIVLLQGGERLQNMLSFLVDLSSEVLPVSRRIKRSQLVFLLDDGLQSMKTPRTLDLCLWDPEVLLRSPRWPIPLGPFREGGEPHFSFLLDEFAFRIWSRTSAVAFESFKNTTHAALARCGREFLPAKDLFVLQNFVVYRVERSEAGSHFVKVDFEQVRTEIPTSVCSGIARPSRFWTDLSQWLKLDALPKSWQVVALEDHAREMSADLTSSRQLFLTAKDFCRWMYDPKLLELQPSCVFFVCSVEVDLVDINGSYFDFARFVSQECRSTNSL